MTGTAASVTSADLTAHCGAILLCGCVMGEELQGRLRK